MNSKLWVQAKKYAVLSIHSAVCVDVIDFEQSRISIMLSSAHSAAHVCLHWAMVAFIAVGATGAGVASEQQQQQQQLVDPHIDDYVHNAETPSNAVGPMQRMLLQHEDGAGLYDDEADMNIGNS